MNEAKFTPGPWEHVAVKGGWDGVTSKCDGLICTLSYNNPANAHLIAAAPELYEALKGCLALLQKDGWYGIEVTAAENVLAKVDAQ
jgi:hypothetical protein